MIWTTYLSTSEGVPYTLGTPSTLREGCGWSFSHYWEPVSTLYNTQNLNMLLPLGILKNETPTFLCLECSLSCTTNNQNKDPIKFLSTPILQSILSSPSTQIPQHHNYISSVRIAQPWLIWLQSKPTAVWNQCSVIFSATKLVTGNKCNRIHTEWADQKVFLNVFSSYNYSPQRPNVLQSTQ